MATEGTDNPAVSRLAVRLPPFWPQKPALWFAQVEASFRCAGITADSTKFALVVSQLDHSYAAEIEDIIVSPPGTEAYAKLKSELIRRVSASEEQRVRQVLTQEEIGDRKPSQYLRHLRSIVDVGTVPDTLLRTLWASRLPSQVQAVIASQTDMPLDTVAELADRIQDALTPPPVNVSIVAHENSAGPAAITYSDYERLCNKVDALAAQMNQLLARRDTSHRLSGHRRRSRSRSQASSTSSTAGQSSPICWYHRKFGDLARKCTSHCEFPKASGNRT